MCSLSQLLLYLLTGGKKKNYILSFLFKLDCLFWYTFSRTLPWETCLSRMATLYNAFKVESGNLYAVPELVIQVRIQLGS